jgi:hypothetical protein
MKKVLILVIAALVVPSAALAAKPVHVKGKSAPKVAYILKGKLSGYTAYDSTTQTNGSITITISHANYHGKALKGQTLTLTVDAETKVTLHDGKAIADGDRGIVKVRAAKRIAAAGVAKTLGEASARAVIDMGVKPAQ